MGDQIGMEDLYERVSEVVDMSEFEHFFQENGIDIFKDMYKNNFGKPVD